MNVTALGLSLKVSLSKYENSHWTVNVKRIIKDCKSNSLTRRPRSLFFHGCALVSVTTCEV